jgi:hypothetical protein
VTRFRPQPNWDFLLSASRSSLQSYELTRLSHAANLRKEIGNLMDQWLEDHSDAAVARLLLTHPMNSPMNNPISNPIDSPRNAPDVPREGREEAAEGISASDNFFPDLVLGPPINREVV